MTNQLNQIDVEQIKEEIFKDTPHHLVADIIAICNPGVKITNRLIETYLDIASSKEFTLDKTISEIRKLNRFESLIAQKHIAELDDGSRIAIDDETYAKLQESINSMNVVEFMCKNRDNFLSVAEIILEE